MRINSNWLALCLWGASVGLAHGEIAIFACEPEYAALAKELAPEADIYSATTALQDPHLVEARPSLIAKMRRADVAICAGAELEVGWLPMLQQKSANPKMRSGALGLFFASDHVETLDQLTRTDRSMGDVHRAGNPHVHLSPPRMLKIAEAFSARLQALDPDNQAQYQANLVRFSERWQQAMSHWQQQGESLAGMKIIGFHSSFRYLYDWLGITQVADLEPKPGVSPSSAHLASLTERAEQGDVSAIVQASYQDKRPGAWLSERTEIPVLVLPMSVGGDDNSQDLFSWYQNLVTQLTSVR
ncbi:metal ABC transporter solute-binding protein, Zn/Mn family [Shewanella sp. NIFS-20-20]|uniref:metal ABC transporter solute-binding protein, Zn/Mn family n=1 Tax=Shewanella sp. NIFS-20-20 TaxID=2853806 RepID=UPI001C488E6C|nr:zinc ABC transporter substrate-binding protein [Shewanella sp. NIFS-20-20]MBV7316197.1 zinc ABC transporter substrate-binding protein [Shewanella sp. NIFS-20-20]